MEDNILMANYIGLDVETLLEMGQLPNFKKSPFDLIQVENKILKSDAWIHMSYESGRYKVSVIGNDELCSDISDTPHKAKYRAYLQYIKKQKK